MRFQIFSHDLLIGSSDLENLDPSMGIAGGAFLPADSYRSVQPVFRLYSEAGLTAADQDQKMLERYWQERDELGLAARLQSGEVVPVQCVHVEDYLAELDEIWVTIMMFDSLTFDQYLEAKV